MNAQTLQYQEQARAAYKRKDYAKALELFDRAIGHSPSLQLHDNRAACLEKLEDFSAALKDAKKAIQIAKEDPTGYVRAGRILIKMERKSVALEIYGLGLKNVKHVGQGFEVLKRAHLDLMTELSSAKSVDPLTVLPRELAEQILDYLNFKQLMNACLVSKEWAQFIRRTPNLWRHLDLSHAKRKVKNAFVARAINTGRYKLKTATLNNLFDLEKALSALARNCPLEELNLRNTGLLAYEVANILKSVKTLKSLQIYKGTTMSRQILSDILKNAGGTLQSFVCQDLSIVLGNTPNLRDFEIADCDFSILQKLELTWSTFWPGMTGLVRELPKMRELRHLKLHQLSTSEGILITPINLDQLVHLTTLDLLIDIMRARHVRLPASLKTLAMGARRGRQATEFFDEIPGGGPLQWSLPLLEEFRLCAAELPFDGFELALRTTVSSEDKPPTRLHTLSMAQSDVRGALTKEVLSHPRLAELKHLSLENCHGANDSHLSIVAATLPQLQSLNVSGTEVTGAGIKEIVNKGLKKLVATECRFVGLDAIQWIRAQGVQVVHRSTDVVPGGKKVRY